MQPRCVPASVPYMSVDVARIPHLMPQLSRFPPSTNSMVLIPVKSQYISLLATVLSGLCELLAFSAALSFAKYFECRSLHRGLPLAYRTHVRRTRIITILSAIAFIAIEVVYSLFSDCDRLMGPETQSCISLHAASQHSQSFPTFHEAYIAALNCTNTHQDTFEQHFGNVSLLNRRTQCSERVAFSYNISSRAQSFPSAIATQQCAHNVCSWAIVRHPLVYVSVPESRAVPNQATNLSFFATRIPERAALEPPATYARRAAQQLAANITDEMDLRRRIFLAASSAQCSFTVDQGAATQIHPALLAFITFVWLSSLICYLGSIVLRRYIFYDMSNPLDWKKLRTPHGLPPAQDAVVICSYQDGKRVLNLSECASEASEAESYSDLSEQSSIPV